MVLWVIFFLGRVVGQGGTGILAKVLELVGMDWMAVMFLTTVTLFAVDLVTVFGFIMPRLAHSLRGWALVAGGALSMIALFQGLRAPKKYIEALWKIKDRLNLPIFMVPPYVTRAAEGIKVFTASGLPAFPSFERAVRR